MVGLVVGGRWSVVGTRLTTIPFTTNTFFHFSSRRWGRAAIHELTSTALAVPLLPKEGGHIAVSAPRLPITDYRLLYL